MSKLIIVESPTKAKTISRFLKRGYKVMATMGHVRDLPKQRFGVKITDNGKVVIEPQYKIIPDKRKIVAGLKKEIKKADEVVLATDLDREGEAIAFHVTYLGKKAKYSRIVFHEITKKAIEKALIEPRKIDDNLVNAQQARRILDRIVGYKLSPLLWRKVRRGLSAGRVQSVAVRLIVEREREIAEFKIKNYFRVWSRFETKAKGKFLAQLVEKEGQKVEVKEKSVLFAGTHTVSRTIFEKLAQAEAVVKAFPSKFQAQTVEEKETKRYPLPPFTTSKMQQDAARKMGWSSKLTMRVAQSLYEKGWITYHRTDSLSLSKQFVAQTRKLIKDEFGEKYLPEKPNFYKTRAKLVQEAHEAIRPTKPARNTLAKGDNRQQKLYQMIWRRAVASQMPPARLRVVKLKIVGDKLVFATQGTRVIFKGFAKVYPVVFSEVTLPPVKEKDELTASDLGLTSHQTQPPPRYSEASLIAALEKEGIGRPSTYAPIISVIQNRNYVEKEEGRFKPTSLGEAVNDFLVSNFPDILNLPFTAKMEKSFDAIAGGKEEWAKVIGHFWRPFIKKTEEAKEKADRVKIETEKTGEKCPECKKGDLIIRIGRFGKFIACSKFPDCKYTRPLVKEADFPCPDCDAPTVIRKTKKGKTFYGCSNWPGCKWASWKKPKTIGKKE